MIPSLFLPFACPAVLLLLAAGLFLLRRAGKHLASVAKHLLSGAGVILAVLVVALSAIQPGFPGGEAAAMLYLSAVALIQAWYFSADGAVQP